MKENAILIRQLDIVKIYVDFSDIDNIYQALDASHVSTIHTQKTQALSMKLGVHLLGYVDREGDDINNRLACEISGYDYLGSFMLLCKGDDKFNPLPFSEAELNVVYTYLTEGKIIPLSSSNDEQSFFEKYQITPILPTFDLKKEVIFLDEYPQIMILKYDESGLFNDGSFMKFGEQLFAFADRIVIEMQTIKDEKGREIHLSKDQKYYLKNVRRDFCFYVFIEANIDNKSPQIIEAMESYLKIKIDS